MNTELDDYKKIIEKAKLQAEQNLRQLQSFSLEDSELIFQGPAFDKIFQSYMNLAQYLAQLAKFETFQVTLEPNFDQLESEKQKDQSIEALVMEQLCHSKGMTAVEFNNLVESSFESQTNEEIFLQKKQTIKDICMITKTHSLFEKQRTKFKQ